MRGLPALGGRLPALRGGHLAVCPSLAPPSSVALPFASQPARCVKRRRGTTVLQRPQRRCTTRTVAATDAAEAERRPSPLPVQALRLAVTLRRLTRLTQRGLLTSGMASIGLTYERKEVARREQAQLGAFTPERWAAHRSTRRYARHMAGMARSRILAGLAQPLAAAGAVAALVCAYEGALESGALPAAAHLPSLLLPALPFEITSSALSLLLVFRTTSSYDRWATAVAAWGAIATRSRDTLRQLVAYQAAACSGGRSGSSGSGGGVSELRSTAAAGRWLVAFSRSLKAEVTEGSDLRAELQGMLAPAELDLLCGAHCPSSFALGVLSQLVVSAPVGDSQLARLDENLTLLGDAAGTCQQLLHTPIPLSYTRHTSRSMLIWLGCLPLGLWPHCGWATVPLTVVVAFLLLGIEEIGVAIEEPFSLLNLEATCLEVEADASGILRAAAATTAATAVATAAASAPAEIVAATTAATTAATPAEHPPHYSPQGVPPLRNAAAPFPLLKGRRGAAGQRRRSASGRSP